MDDLQDLIAILRQVGPKKIWRPVVAPGDRLLADGCGFWKDGLPEDERFLDFRNKTVVDIGCNFGYYTFRVHQRGALHVTGIDADERIISGCRILKRMHGTKGVSFIAADATREDDFGRYDTGLLIDVIGKQAVVQGTMKRYLDAIEKLSKKEMILSIRPDYNLKKHMGNDARGLSQMYSGTYVGRHRFHTLAYVRDRFSRDWHMTIVHPKSVENLSAKATLHFMRKP